MFMAFALSPDKGDPLYHGLPRILRFVPHLVGRTIATLDRANNLLVIDRGKFDQLAEFEKREVLFTHSAEIVFEDLPKWK